VARLEAIVTVSFPDSIVDRLKAEFDTACVAINGWQEHIQLKLPVFLEVRAREALSELRAILRGFKQRKESDILESIGLEEDKLAVLEKWQVLLDLVAETNQEIRNCCSLLKDTRYMSLGTFSNYFAIALVLLAFKQCRFKLHFTQVMVLLKL